MIVSLNDPEGNDGERALLCGGDVPIVIMLLASGICDTL